MVDKNVKATADFTSLLKEIQKVSAEWAKLAKSQEKAIDASDKIAKNLDAQAKVFVQLNKTIASLDKDIKANTVSQRQYQSQIKSTTGSIIEQKKAADDLARSFVQEAKRSADFIQKGFTQEAIAKVKATPVEVIDYKNQIGRLRELQAQHRVSHDQIKQMWSDLATGNIRAYTGGLRQIQNQLVKVKSSQDALGASSKKAFAADAEIARTTARIEAEKRAVDELTRSIQRQAKLSSTYLQKGYSAADVKRLQATPKEIIDFKNQVSRLKELQIAHQVSHDQIKRIWADLGAGEVKAYTGSLRKVQDQLIKLRAAQEALGASSRKAFAADAEIAKKTAQINAQKIAVENLQKAIRRQAELSAAYLQKGFSAQDQRILQATPKETYDFKNQIGRLKELQLQHQVTHNQIKRMWADIGSGNVKAYSGSLRQIQNQLIKVQAAQQALGASWRKQVDAEAAAFVQASKYSGSAIKQTQKLKSAITDVTVSWKSFARLLAVQVFHQAVSAGIRTLREGIAKTLELGVKIAEIQTISQNQPLVSSSWIKGLRELSDSWGLDLLDQVESAYQAVSNQITEGAETFKFLAQASQFAVTAVTDNKSAVNLLSSAINAFKLSVSDTNKAAASFFRTIELGRVRAAEMADSYGRLAVPAAALGLTMDEVNASIATSTIQGLKYSEASTYLRNVFLKLIKPTEAMKKFFAEIGVESGQAAIQTYGWVDLLQKLSIRFNNNTTEIGKMMGRLRALVGAMLLSGENFESYKRNLDEIATAQEDYAARTAIVMETPEKKIQIQLERIKNFFTVDLAKAGIDKLNTALSGDFNLLSASIKGFADTVKMLAVPAVAGLGLALASLIGLSNPVTALVAALGALALGLNTIRRYQEEGAAEIDRETKANQERWLQDEIDAITKSYDEKRKQSDKYYQDERQKIALLRAYDATQFEKSKSVYKSSLTNIKDYGTAISESIKKEIKSIDQEISRLNSAIKSSAKNFKNDIALLNFSIERRLSGKDTPSGAEPTTEKKFQFLQAYIRTAEEQLRQSAVKIDREQFDVWSAQLKRTITETIETADKYMEETGRRKLHGEKFFRYWSDQINLYEEKLNRAARAEREIKLEEKSYLQDDLKRIKDVVKLATAVKPTEFFKIDDPAKLQEVFKRQSEAIDELSKYDKSYGAEFYKQAELSKQRLELEQLIQAKIVDFGRAAALQLLTDQQKRQEEELRANEEIWIEYVKNARSAFAQVKQFRNQALESVKYDKQGNRIPGRFASGRSAGIDNQLAWISPDEFIINPRASRHFHSSLAAMNSSIRRFGSGGPSYQVGDLNFYDAPISKNGLDVRSLGRKLRREVKLGKMRLN